MKKDDLHAFPQPPEISGRGMSLRDYFAAKAMQAYRLALTNHDCDKIARWAYADADAMLAERDK